MTKKSQMIEAAKIVKLFHKNLSLTKISINFVNRLMLTKTGKVLQFFSKLKSLPDSKVNKRKKKGIIF